MTTLFLHPPFDKSDVLAAILPEARLRSRPATLEGYALAGDDGARIALVPRPGTAVAGRLAEPSEDERARLDFAMAALGAAPVPVTMPGADGAAAYVFADAPPAELVHSLAHRLDQPLPRLAGGLGGRAVRRGIGEDVGRRAVRPRHRYCCLLYTSDAADEL